MKAIAALGVALALGAGPCLAQQEVAEQRLKLAYLYNFAQFVEWPAARLPAGAPLRLCLVGAEPFGSEIEALRSRRVRTHPIEIERPSTLSELSGCHIVYAERLDGPGVPRLADWARSAALLLVSSQSGALRRGASIQFVVQDNRLRWHLDKDLLRELGLTVSAKLIELSLPPPAP